jgi:hypothetical protein
MACLGKVEHPTSDRLDQGAGHVCSALPGRRLAGMATPSQKPPSARRASTATHARVPMPAPWLCPHLLAVRGGFLCPRRPAGRNRRRRGEAEASAAGRRPRPWSRGRGRRDLGDQVTQLLQGQVAQREAAADPGRQVDRVGDL